MTDDTALAANEKRAAELLNRDWAPLIAGERPTTAANGTFAVTNPYSGETIAEIPDAGKADVERAVAAAHEAFPGWARASVAARGQALRELADAIEARANDFAVLDAVDGGAPVSIMLLDVKIAVAACGTSRVSAWRPKASRYRLPEAGTPVPWSSPSTSSSHRRTAAPGPHRMGTSRPT